MSRSARALPAVCLLIATLLPANAQQGPAAPRLDPEQFERSFEFQRRERERRLRSDVPVPAAPTTQQAGSTKPIVRLTGVVIEGARSFDQETLAATYRPYLGRNISEADLIEITRQLSEIYRNAGFHLSRAIVPAQDISGGAVKIRIIEGAITTVTVEGSVEPRVRLLLAPVLAENPSRLSTLERQLLRINDTPGYRIADTSLEEIGEMSGRFRLTVVMESWRVQSSITLDNRGISAIGPLQSHFVSATNSTLLSGDVAGVHISAIPDTPKELTFGQIWYEAPVDMNGSRLGVFASYGEIRPSDIRQDTDTVTRSKSVELRYTSVPIRSRASSLWVTGSLAAGNFWEADDNGAVYDDRLRTVALTADYHHQDQTGAWNYLIVGVRQGLPILGASERGDPFLSRADGDGTFSKLQFAYTRIQMLNELWSVRLATAGQLASTALLASQEFNLGGALFGRGYDTAELSGDSGIAGSFEIRFDHKQNNSMMSGMQFYGFIDGGAVRDFRGGPDFEGSLASAGGGIRLFLAQDFLADFGVAVPIMFKWTPNAYRDPRFFFVVSTAFKACPDRAHMRCS
jgi:hemolysin activation/secretion protein